MRYSAAAMELPAGRVVQGWCVEEPLGRGAMAVVYRVRHAELGTLAALKVLDRLDPVTESRLLREGRAQASIDHPGIVSVLDFLRIDGHAALLLEYVPGSDLSALLARRALPLPEALDLFRQITLAVSAAHAAGLVHRDLKPSNVLVSETPRGLVAKVGDFGLVKLEDTDLTATHAVLGTPKYMAPEQMRAGRNVDARADLFAMGCVLYELVCGRPAFSGDDLVALYAAKNSGRYTPPEHGLPELPARVRTAIVGCLEASVGRRIPTCEALLAILDGAPWTSASADETLDVELGASWCPACGAAVPGDSCPACGADPALAQRYRLVDRLGACTWRALDLRDGRWIVIRAARGTDPEARARFDRGARLALELHHPQIARALGPAFDEHGRRWQARERIEGRSLAEGLAARRLGEAEVLEVVLALSAPLRYLAGLSPAVVHRTLLPAHVVRTDDGRLVLVDLGDARDALGDGSLLDRPETAPESWVGEATPASDVFGLGALAVTLLARRPAHELRVGERIVFEDRVAASEGTKRLLAAMTEPEPARRPTIAEVSTRAAELAEELHRPAPPTVNLPLRLGVLLVLLGFLVLSLGLGLGTASVAVLLSNPMFTPYEALSPDRILAPGSDLANRAVPDPDCGAPFARTVRVDGQATGARIPLTLVRTCDGTIVPLGDAEAGLDTVLELPGTGTLRVPWATSTCTVGTDPPRSCGAIVLDGPGAEIALTTNAPRPMKLTDVSGAPIAGARFQDPGVDRLPAFEVSSGTDGVVPFPVGFDGRGSLLVDGVIRRFFWDMPTNTLRVHPKREISDVVVVDPTGAPIGAALVACHGGRGAVDPNGTRGRTDAGGLARCDTEVDVDRWAEVSAPGFVSTTTPLLQPTIRVTLVPARTFHVGCAGLPGDECTALWSPPTCGLPDGKPAGACRFVQNSLICDCDPRADHLVQGVLGTVPLPADGDDVWFDVRGIHGSVEGVLPDGPPSYGNCEIGLVTTDGSLRTWTGADGRFSLAGVPPGFYGIKTRCTNGAVYGSEAIRVLAEGVTTVALTVEQPATGPLVATSPKPAAPAAAQAPDRTLVVWKFPKRPAGEASGACDATVAVDATGLPTDVSVTGCQAAQQEAATAALRSWRWKTATEATTEQLRVPFED